MVPEMTASTYPLQNSIWFGVPDTSKSPLSKSPTSHQNGFAAEPAHRALAGTEISHRGTILVIDPEVALCRLLTVSLRRLGYTIESAHTGKDGLDRVQQHSYQLIIMDLILPDMDGFNLCSEIRRVSAVPVMVLSALTHTDTIVRALESGADGFVRKPFHFNVLEAKVQALMRRVYQLNQEHLHVSGKCKPVNDGIIHCGDLLLDSGLRKFTCGGRKISLTDIECRLLQYLLQYPDKPVTKTKLLAAVWGYEDEDAINLVELAIGRLRKKVETDPSKPKWIITIRGIGYMLCTHITQTPAYRTHTLRTERLHSKLERCGRLWTQSDLGCFQFAPIA